MNSKHTATPETLVEAIRNMLNSVYALRDHAQAEGMKAEVEQKIINIGIKALTQAEGNS